MRITIKVAKAMKGHRNEKHWLTDEEVEEGTFGETLEAAVIEIRNLMPRLESAFRESNSWPRRSEPRSLASTGTRRSGESSRIVERYAEHPIDT
ncbi:MAG: hypothetical protein ACSLFD_09280 [Solirubrobacterales bacterium]